MYSSYHLAPHVDHSLCRDAVNLEVWLCLIPHHPSLQNPYNIYKSIQYKLPKLVELYNLHPKRFFNHNCQTSFIFCILCLQLQLEQGNESYYKVYIVFINTISLTQTMTEQNLTKRTQKQDLVFMK